MIKKSFQKESFQHQKLIYDTWTSIFFWSFIEKWKKAPTQAIFRLIVKGSLSTIEKSVLSKIQELSSSFSFFHWHLEFPEVFTSKNGSFDCILTNPPWERIKVEEREFFASRAPEIATAKNTSQRRKLIKKLAKKNNSLFNQFQKAIQDTERIKKFLRHSDRFPLTAIGDINTYSVFSELVRDFICSSGRSGIVVPSGLVTDKTTSKFFANLMEHQSISNLSVLT